MDDAAAQAIKSDLDRALTEVGPNVGIAFGTELFAEFRKRGWLTLETFGVLGTTFLATKLPAYSRTHHAFATWDVPDLEFRVGKDDARQKG